MNEKMKKDLIYLLIVFFVFLAGSFIVFDILMENSIKDYDIQNASFKEKYNLFMNIDACLDSAVCKEGLKLKMNDGKEIIINKDTCKQYNGAWREKYNDCFFRD